MKCFPKKPNSSGNLRSHYLYSGHPWSLTNHNCLVRSGSRHNLLFLPLLLHHPWGHMVLTVTLPWLLLLWTDGVVSDILRSAWESRQSRPTFEIAIWAQCARRLHHETSPHQPVTCSLGNPIRFVLRQTTFLEIAPRRLVLNLEFISKCYF